MGTITKALNLLNHFTELTPSIGLVEMTRLSGQDKATVHRYLTELERNGFLEQDSKTRKYRLGSALLRLSFLREKTFPTSRIISNRVNGLSEELGELVHASLLQGNRLSPLYYKDAGSGGTRVYFDLADMIPFHATASGMAMLAFGDKALVKNALVEPLARYTENTITDPKLLLSRVEIIRSAGFAFSDQGVEIDVSSVAVPFFQDENQATGSIAIAVPITRMNAASKTKFVHALWRTSEAITRELGGSVPAEVKKVWRDEG